MNLSTLPPWLQYLLPALGLFGVSLAASFWSDYVRRLGPLAKPWQLSLSAALNMAAANPHKALRAATAAEEAQPPKASATHRCKVCRSLWQLHADSSWSLVSGALPSDTPRGRAGACCDNAPMGEQIEKLPEAAP